MTVNNQMSGMTCEEIFRTINDRQIQALMFHDGMSDFYDFLGLYGFKRWHYHQYKSESKEHKHTKHYFMKLHNKLIQENPTPIAPVIPTDWFKYTRMDVTSQIKKQYTESSFKRYKEWEEETKALYVDCAKALYDMGNICDYSYVLKLIEDVKSELVCIYKYMVCMKSVDYDMNYVMDIQDKIHRKYK